MTYEHVQRVKARHEAELLAIEGVQGVGIGQQNGDLAITVLVDHDGNRFRGTLPSELESVPVLVEESGVFDAY
jgi:hypothetical protein